MLPVAGRQAQQRRAPEARAADVVQPPLKRRDGCAGTHVMAKVIHKKTHAVRGLCFVLIAIEG